MAASFPQKRRYQGVFAGISGGMVDADKGQCDVFKTNFNVILQPSIPPAKTTALCEKMEGWKVRFTFNATYCAHQT